MLVIESLRNHVDETVQVDEAVATVSSGSNSNFSLTHLPVQFEMFSKVLVLNRSNETVDPKLQTSLLAGLSDRL